MPELIFLIIVSVYFLLLVIFSTGIKKRLANKTDHNYPFVSVIVCARNEENNINECLNSLVKLDYPSGSLELIIVDDQSEDSTGSIIDKFAADNILIKKIVSSPNAKLKGKINALAAGINASRGEIIFLTDADCTVKENWIVSMFPYFDSQTGMVCGYTFIEGESLFPTIQRIDLLFLLAVAAGTCNIGKPVSCIGNNLSFRKEAYLATGGFENLPFSVTEDFLLMNAINKNGKYSIKFPFEFSSSVKSNACPDIKSLYHQKKRWGKGGTEASSYGLFVMSIAFLSNLSVLITPLFFSPVWLYLMIFKIAADYFFIYPVLYKFESKRRLDYFLLFEIYYIIYITLLPFILLFDKRVLWKERKY